MVSSSAIGAADAVRMCNELSALGLFQRALLDDTLARWRTRIRVNLELVLWRVHAKVIQKTYYDNGMLEHVTRLSVMSAADRARVVVAYGWIPGEGVSSGEYDGQTAEDDWYCL
jgi:hypothetical protein